MDGIGVAQQYYIAAGASPSDDRVRVLKYGKTFAVFNRYGDIEPLGLGEHGIFFEGTRYLSELALLLWKWRGANSALRGANLFHLLHHLALYPASRPIAGILYSSAYAGTETDTSIRADSKFPRFNVRP